MRGWVSFRSPDPGSPSAQEPRQVLTTPSFCSSNRGHGLVSLEQVVFAAPSAKGTYSNAAIVVVAKVLTRESGLSTMGWRWGHA